MREGPLLTQKWSLGFDHPIQRPPGRLIKTPANDLTGGNPNNGVIYDITRSCAKQGFSSGGERVRDPSDLHTPRLPRRKHIINHQRDIGVAQNIAELLGSAHKLPTDVDHIELGIVAKTNRRDLWPAIRPHGR